MTDFSSDHILQTYQRLNEINWLRNTEEEIPLEEEREDEGETIVVKNNGNINCSNDKGDN